MGKDSLIIIGLLALAWFLARNRQANPQPTGPVLTVNPTLLNTAIGNSGTGPGTFIR